MKNRRMKGSMTATIAFLVVSGFLVLVLGSRQVYRASTDPAWVASTDLKAGEVIKPEFLKRARSGDAEGSVKDPRALVGKQLKTDKEKGDTFSRDDLDTPPKEWLAQHVPEGRVLYTLTPRTSSIPYTQLRYGDRLDVLVRGSHGVRMVARDVLLVGALKSNSNGGSQAKGRGLLTSLAQLPDKKSDGKGGTPLVLAVIPEHVYPLAGIGESEEVSTVLHGSIEVQQGEILQVKPGHRGVELVNGLQRKQVLVRN